ncbi:MAG TPA: HSP90 family protein [Actinocrinis sp.]
MSQPEPSHTFQVDLRGMVDLLSRHLYSSPRVFIRELMQNAVDAITARRQADPEAPVSITITITNGSTLTVTDTGIGLTEDEVHRFLATIGHSSKRDDEGIALARTDFIGQFGIGLLACFVVADVITVRTRSARDPQAPAVQWQGYADGRYSLEVLPASAQVEPGTTVTLVPRPGAEEWFENARVARLARHYGSLLRYPVTLAEAGMTTQITDTPPVWDRPYGSMVARRDALFEYARRVFEFTPLDVIDLDLPLVGLRGVAYVLPTPVHPSRTTGHRVHLRGMLLSDDAVQLLPEWAFFVRCVVDTDALRPTASREALYDDETLAAVRDALGARLRDWLAELAAGNPGLLNRFLSVHHLAVKALARYDDQLLRMLLPWLPFETTDGTITLDEFAAAHPVILVTQTVEEFRQVASIASAAGLAVVNGGYTYDHELVRRLPEIRPQISVLDLDPATVTAHLESIDPAQELAAAGFLALARDVVDQHGCDVALRSFHPVTIPALLVDNREARHERLRAEHEAGADPLWSDILGALRSAGPRAQLVLNHQCALVRKVASIRDRDLAASAVEGLYGQALLLSRRPLRQADHALLNRAFMTLLEHAAHEPAAAGEDGR